MAERKHFFDASRAFLMFLGIPMHAAVVYSTDSSWLVHSPDTSPVFGLLTRFIHSFRMGAFFIIAGYFSVVLLRRSDAVAWYRGRLIRLGLPLASFAVLVNAPNQAILLYLKAPREGWGSAAASAAADPGLWILHLWFLIDLLMLSAGAAVLWHFRNRCIVAAPCTWVADVVARRPWASALVGLPLIGAVRVLSAVAAALLGEHRLVFWTDVDLHRAVGSAPVFAFGMLLAARPAVLARMLRVRWWSASLAIASAAFIAIVSHRFGRVGNVAVYMLTPFTGIFMAHVLFATADRLLVHPSSRVLWLAQSSFSVYLFHHPIVIALALALLGLSVSPALEFTVIVVVATAFSLAAHRVVQASPALLLLFNGVSTPRTPAPGASLAGSP